MTGLLWTTEHGRSRETGALRFQGGTLTARRLVHACGRCNGRAGFVEYQPTIWMHTFTSPAVGMAISGTLPFLGIMGSSPREVASCRASLSASEGRVRDTHVVKLPSRLVRTACVGR